MDFKTCTLCQTTKPLADFYSLPSASDGRMSACGECIKKKAAERRAQNPELHRAAARRYYRKNKERMLAKARRWKKENPERARAYRRANPECPLVSRLRARRWRLDNPEKYRQNMAAASARRRARKQNQSLAAGRAEYARIEAVYAIATWLRSHGDDVQVDHIVPLSRGGLHRYTNLQILPAAENRSKSDRDPSIEELAICETLRRSVA